MFVVNPVFKERLRAPSLARVRRRLPHVLKNEVQFQMLTCLCVVYQTHVCAWCTKRMPVRGVPNGALSALLLWPHYLFQTRSVLMT